MAIVTSRAKSPRIWAPTLSCQLVHISCSLAGSRTVPIAASMSLPLIGLPSSVPWPLPYSEAMRVPIVASSSAAPERAGAGSVMPVRSRSILRAVSNDRPGTFAYFAASVASCTCNIVCRAPACAASASVSSVMKVALTQEMRFTSTDSGASCASAEATKASASCGVSALAGAAGAVCAEAGATASAIASAAREVVRRIMNCPCGLSLSMPQTVARNCANVDTDATVLFERGLADIWRPSCRSRVTRRKLESGFANGWRNARRPAQLIQKDHEPGWRCICRDRPMPLPVSNSRVDITKVDYAGRERRQAEIRPGIARRVGLLYAKIVHRDPAEERALKRASSDQNGNLFDARHC